MSRPDSTAANLEGRGAIPVTLYFDPENPGAFTSMDTWCMTYKEYQELLSAVVAGRSFKGVAFAFRGKGSPHSVRCKRPEMLPNALDVRVVEGT